MTRNFIIAQLAQKINDLIPSDIYKKKTVKVKELKNGFYEIMRKYGIKQGTPSFDAKGKKIGRNCNTPEWVMCETLFWTLLQDRIELDSIFSFDLPEDLMEYDE